ncbi:hypothetical protein TCAL_07952 [Tigriopus californicus]|uniref:Serine/threonine-protein phosphatase 2A activator n=1 Tax=Tigriopus californicus TaxID=6832 RepID=A0A553NDD5_TIGCA|nr:serine/threonine-protein phosphatase 2A activator-like [Tigriopus californicus]XP_059094632.1 serine/threonine-protein phosphatase 2A activator-like [Tigriopus californicus]TRY63461.1 hypothetical protein TCAL_07952 [Tigriopus californicus]|eukprot:TCALIF_07952-PA protein Name:"Similar to Ppp2r4 Serine/threonine-protein phosphatase 2A activator (Mus musculus)" AED:0.07 eAED:0.07 QI:345/1/1/1/0.75/0.6/5/113/357
MAFVTPEKLIKTPNDIEKWHKSETYSDYIRFITGIGDGLKNKKIHDPNIAIGESAQKLIDLLETLSGWVDDIKPFETPNRFGNKAFRDWHAKLKENGTSLLRDILPDALKDASDELSIYLVEAFGNATRIDYGTGHEMAFVMLLLGLSKIEYLTEADKDAMGLPIFDKYMCLTRKLQKTYRMEPAGSQGVWSLDDFHFIPYIWGAAQFVSNSRISPKSIPNEDMAQSLARDYHLFGCIQYIFEVKQGPFAEHSNQLWNVSGVATWDKVYQGLVKMYRAEILSKFPVIQHVYFGSIFTLQPAKNPLSEVPNSHRRPDPSSFRGAQMPSVPPTVSNPRMVPGNFPRMGPPPYEGIPKQT